MLNQQSLTNFPGSAASAATSQLTGPDSAAWFKDDFFSWSSATSITTIGNGNSDTCWSVIQIAGGTQTIDQKDGAYNNPGQLLMTTSAVSGQGVAIFKGRATQGALGNLAAQGGWELNVILALPVTTLVAVRAGVCAAGQHAADAPTNGMYIEYDTANAGNTNARFTYVTRAASTPTYSTTNAVLVDTNFHQFKIRSVVAGTILFSTDGGTETAIATTVPTAIMTPFVQLISRTAGAKTLNLDFFSYFANITR